MPDFKYYRASSVEDAVKLMDNPQAKLKAGGTDLIPQMKRGALSFETLIDICGIKSLEKIHETDNTVEIGPLVSLNQLIHSEIVVKYCPVLSESASTMAGPQIRNMGTIGGNICNASPAGDMIPGLIVMDAHFEITGTNGIRNISADEFFTGPGKTVMTKNEMLTKIVVPKLITGAKAVYIKHGRRNAMEIAQVGVACMICQEDKITKTRIALGAVAPTPIRALEAEKILTGSDGNAGIIVEAAKAARSSCKPITDVRTTSEYRAEIVEVLTKRAINACMKEN